MLSDRDIQIFRTLARYRYLRSNYLHMFAGGASVTRFKERLGDLFHEGFLDRPEQQWQFAEARCRPVVHALGRRARPLLQESGWGVADAGFERTACRQFAHALMASESLASIELATMEQPGVRFIPAAEILSRAPDSTRHADRPLRLPSRDGGVIPDGVFGLEYQLAGKNAYRFFALEADRGTMPVSRADRRQTSFAAKVVAYRRVLGDGVHKRHWGISRLLVLTVTTSEARLGSMLDVVNAGASDSAAFLFRVLRPDETLSPSKALLSEPWHRAGHSPLAIGSAE